MITPLDFFSKLESQLNEGLAFVAYKNSPDSTLVKALLQKDKALHVVKDFAESGFVFAPFDSEKEKIYIPSESSLELHSQIDLTSEVHVKNDSESPVFLNSEKDKSVHMNLVQKGIEAIKNNEFQKVVLSRKEEIPLENPNAISIFKKLLQKYPTAFVYVWFHPETGIWLGATPETLISIERNKFKTMALAATQKFSGTTNVQWGGKEKEEQEIVTFSILESLKKSGIVEVKTSDAYTTKAGNLLHIRTDIEGNLNPLSPIKEVVSRLHPTPAVCGLPKEMTKFFILKNESYDREFYTGFLGEMNMKSENKRNSNKRNQENQAYSSVVRKTSLFVNLRCMKLSFEKASIFVGGGITKDSNPQSEWEETVNKSHTMKAVFQK